MTTHQPPDKGTAISWIAPVEGFSLFGALPPQLVIDSRITPADLRIFCALLIHADASGYARVSQARLAELLGFSSVRCITAALGSGGLGGPPGKLVRLGYVKNLGQSGYNEPNRYQLATPIGVNTVDATVLEPEVMPSVSTSEVPVSVFRTAKPRQLSKSDYIAGKKSKAKKDEQEIFNKNVCEVDGELYMLLDAIDQMNAYNENGITPTLPDAVFIYFNLKLVSPEY